MRKYIGLQCNVMWSTLYNLILTISREIQKTLDLETLNRQFNRSKMPLVRTIVKMSFRLLNFIKSFNLARPLVYILTRAHICIYAVHCKTLPYTSIKDLNTISANLGFQNFIFYILLD